MTKAEREPEYENGTQLTPRPDSTCVCPDDLLAAEFQAEPDTDFGAETAMTPFLCPVDEAARIVGQKWTLQIVHHLLDGRSRRFCELQDALGKVNPSTLSSRLKMLEEAGLVSRSQISDIPPHVEYRLTEMGAGLRGVINEITRWSNAHLCTPRRRSANHNPATKRGQERSLPVAHAT